MEPTTTATDQNRWWRAACGDTAGMLLDILTPPPARPLRDLACRAAGTGPLAAPKPTPTPARDTVEGVVRQGRQALPDAPHSLVAEIGAAVLERMDRLHVLEHVLEAVGVESTGLALANTAGGVGLLIKFIGEIARANAEGKHMAACHATARGFATVMAEVLDRGSLRSSTVASLRDRARELGPTLAARMWLGAQAAAKALHGLTSTERNRVRDELLSKTTHLQVGGATERQLYVKTQGLLLGLKPARY
jgi:hypothetical protein